MKVITLDIETIPTQKPGALEEFRANIQPPGNISKPESISKWMQENAASAAEEKFRKTACDGTQGEIVCIGWAIDEYPAQCIFRDYKTETEDKMLTAWFNRISHELSDSNGGYKPPSLVVGHNVLGFDLRFIYQRAVINQVRPSFPLRQDARYNGEFVFDTMLAWGGWGNRIGLATICDALGVTVKSGGIDGSKVWDAVQEGRIQEVADYCKEDVEATREVYWRMTFQERRAA